GVARGLLEQRHDLAAHRPQVLLGLLAGLASGVPELLDEVLGLLEVALGEGAALDLLEQPGALGVQPPLGPGSAGRPAAHLGASPGRCRASPWGPARRPGRSGRTRPPCPARRSGRPAARSGSRPPWRPSPGPGPGWRAGGPTAWGR